MPKGSSYSFWRIGSANAAVFPLPDSAIKAAVAGASVSHLPVCALPTTFCPLRAGGIHCCWTGVGLTIPMLLHVSVSHLLIPSSTKVAIFARRVACGSQRSSLIRSIPILCPTGYFFYENF